MTTSNSNNRNFRYAYTWLAWQLVFQETSEGGKKHNKGGLNWVYKNKSLLIINSIKQKHEQEK